MADYYNILGVGREASAEEIRSAYLVKAKLYHPDVNKGADAKLLFQQLNEAYHVLADQDKRTFYNTRVNDDINLYRKYGKNYGNRQAGNNIHTEHYSSYTSHRQSEEEESVVFGKIKKHTDVALFYTMIAIGVLIIIYGLRDLFFEKWEGEKNIRGIVFGVSFTGILLYGWRLKTKVKNQK